MTNTNQSPQHDIQQLTTIIERIHRKTYQDYLRCFETFLDVSLEAINRMLLLDLSWKPELGDFEKARDEFAEGFAILLAQIHPDYTYQDIVGGAYMNLGTSSKGFGQFFTPWNVARMMAEITLSQPDLSRYTPERPMTICDPSCGSGVMLLAAASCLPRSFIDEGRVAFYGMDVDRTCISMAQLNVRLYGLNVPGGFVKPTQDLTPQELDRLPEPHKSSVQQTLFDLREQDKAA